MGQFFSKNKDVLISLNGKNYIEKQKKVQNHIWNINNDCTFIFYDSINYIKIQITFTNNSLDYVIKETNTYYNDHFYDAVNYFLEPLFSEAFYKVNQQNQLPTIIQDTNIYLLSLKPKVIDVVLYKCFCIENFINSSVDTFTDCCNHFIINFNTIDFDKKIIVEKEFFTKKENIKNFLNTTVCTNILKENGKLLIDDDKNIIFLSNVLCIILNGKENDKIVKLINKKLTTIIYDNITNLSVPLNCFDYKYNEIINDTILNPDQSIPDLQIKICNLENKILEPYHNSIIPKKFKLYIYIAENICVDKLLSFTDSFTNNFINMKILCNKTKIIKFKTLQKKYCTNYFDDLQNFINFTVESPKSEEFGN